MSKKEKSYYLEALKLYQKGNLMYALGKCEEGISKNLKDCDLLNLKGLILYVKGELKEAEAIWKINREYNNCDIAKSYLNDIKDDYKRLRLYNEATEDIKGYRISEGLKKLKICLESNFNQIQVNNALALCYLKKGELELSKYHLSKVYEVDKSNKSAKLIEKEIAILDDGRSKFKYNKKVILVASTMLLLIPLYMLIKPAETKGEPEKNINKVELPKKDTPKAEVANVEIMNEAKLSYQEVEERYKNALEAFNNSDYKRTVELLNSTYNSLEGNHLESHIIFFLGSAYFNLNDYENSQKYLLEYEEKFIDGSYIEETYYKIALLNKDRNKEKSKNYAYNLAYNYPNSIYNNSIIEGILYN